MSTLAYASLTTQRDEAAPGTSTTTSPPGVKSYVDALAALVPAEVLTLHALILSVTTKTEGTPVSTTITDPTTLGAAFWALIGLSIVLYVLPRFNKWDKLDYFRLAIPPIAFVAWTMLQRATAFDAVFPAVREAPRSVIGLFIAVLLGLAAAALAKKADEKPRTP